MRTISRWLSQEFHAWLAGVISWEEKALAILNGPALKYAAFAAAFVMRIPALSGIPGIDVAYSCLVLLGVDVQYIACIRQAAEAQKHRWLWIVVSAVLAIPVFQTNAVFTLHSQTGIPELAAMNLIHLSPTAWALECAALLVILMAVSALSRPKQHVATMSKATADAFSTAIAAIAATPPSPTPPDKPRRRREPVLTLMAERPSAVRTPRTPDQLASFENVARDAFKAGAKSIDRMMKATGMGRTAAASWTRTLKAEAAAEAAAAAKKQKVA